MLRSAVAAVMAQDYEGEIECVLVFDGTPIDDSLTAEGGMRKLRSMHNSRKPGLAGARNTGIAAATGDYVAFCDDDDKWLPSKLREQVSGLGSAHSSATGITIEYADRRVARVPRQADMTLEKVVRTRQMAAHPSTVLIRRSELLEIGMVDEELPGSYAEDFDFMIRILQSGPVNVVEKPLVTVRWGQSQFSRDWATIRDAIDYLITKHEVIRSDRRALARLYGRRGFAEAALGNRTQALKNCARTVRLFPLERRTLAILPVAMGLVGAERLMHLAHQRGRGI